MTSAFNKAAAFNSAVAEMVGAGSPALVAFTGGTKVRIESAPGGQYRLVMAGVPHTPIAEMPDALVQAEGLALDAVTFIGADNIANRARMSLG